MDIEEAIKILKEFVKQDRKMRDYKVESDYDKFCEERCIAIETVINELDYKQDDINVLKTQRDSVENQLKQAKAELEKEDKRIKDLEYALLDMVMQFADRPHIKGSRYALSTMGLSSLETAFSELNFDDPMPVSKAEEKYRILEKQYFEKVEDK